MNHLTICLIIFVITIGFYCWGKISLATVSITGLIVLTLTGCLDPDAAVSYFANDNVITIGGMCVVAAGFNRTSFCTKLANRISDTAKGSLNKMMFGYMVIAMLLTQFIQSPVVVFGIVAPMLKASAESMGVKPSKVIFPLGITTIITCSTLPLGAGATVAAEFNGYLESYGYTDYTVGVLDPMKGRLPLLILCVLYCSFIATKFAPDEPPVPVIDELKAAAAKAPLGNFAEHAGVIIFFADAIALMFASQAHIENWVVTVAGAILMVLCGVLKPKEAAGAVPVSMLLLMIGALAMSGALSATGAGEMIGNYISKIVIYFEGNSYLTGAIFFLVPFIMTQVMHNRGTMLIFHPIAIATCASIHANPIGLMICIQAACLSSYMTPMSTSATPYIMGYGGYDQKSMFKQSPIMAILCFVVTVGWTMTIFPMF